jgi:hypothetical protein
MWAEIRAGQETMEIMIGVIQSAQTKFEKTASG